MKKYYLHNGSEQDGPFNISELKNKGVTRKTEIWYEGLKDWTAADQINELNELFTTSPPPIKNKTSSHKNTPKQEYNNLGKNILKLGLLAVGVIAFFLIIDKTLAEDTDAASSTYFEKKMTIEEIENTNPIRFLSINGEYNESFWGTELKIKGSIVNSATVADYKDVTLKVTYYSKTKSILGFKEYTLYEIYKPNTATPFKLDIDNHKNVETIGWKIVRALPNK